MSKCIHDYKEVGENSYVCENCGNEYYGYLPT